MFLIRLQVSWRVFAIKFEASCPSSQSRCPWTDRSTNSLCRQRTRRILQRCMLGGVRFSKRCCIVSKGPKRLDSIDTEPFCSFSAMSNDLISSLSRGEGTHKIMCGICEPEKNLEVFEVDCLDSKISRIHRIRHRE